MFLFGVSVPVLLRVSLRGRELQRWTNWGTQPTKMELPHVWIEAAPFLKLTLAVWVVFSYLQKQASLSYPQDSSWQIQKICATP